MRTRQTRTAFLLSIFTLAVFAFAGCSHSGSEGDSTPGKTVSETSGTGVSSSSDTTNTELLTVVFTNNIDGEIEPCG